MYYIYIILMANCPIKQMLKTDLSNNTCEWKEINTQYLCEIFSYIIAMTPSLRPALTTCSFLYTETLVHSLHNKVQVKWAK